MSETNDVRADFEDAREWTLANLLHPVELPDKRADFPANMLPITAEDRAMLEDEFGRDIADAVLHMQVDHARSGGISPGARKFLYPNGIDNPMDTEALLTILTNHLVWDQSGHF